MFLKVLGRVLLGDGSQGLDGLVPDYCLLYGGERFQRWEEAVYMLLASDQRSEVAKLFGQGQKNFILANK